MQVYVLLGMGIKFKVPKLDTCSMCDTLQAKIGVADHDSIDFQLLKEQQRIHHLEADVAYKCKEHDKRLSTTDITCKTYTFDLQQCLPTPFLKSNVSFYKRQLWTYNLTVHDCETNDPYCYMWDEASAGRGGNDIASCIFKHLNTLTEIPNIKTVIFYSDSCVGQNKNSFVSAMFLAFLENSKTIEQIDHKFLVVGHTHMECDSDHAAIERKKKRTTVKIHHPRDWFQFVRSVGESRKFKVVEMKQDDFLDFSAAVKNKFMWRNTNNDSEKFVWKEVKWLRYTKADFGKILYKTSLDDNETFKTLNIRRRGVNTINYSDLGHPYSDGKPITKEKKSDLIFLLPQIDPVFHDFYKNLKTTDDMLNVHPDLLDDE